MDAVKPITEQLSKSAVSNRELARREYRRVSKSVLIVGAFLSLAAILIFASTDRVDAQILVETFAGIFLFVLLAWGLHAAAYFSRKFSNDDHLVNHQIDADRGLGSGRRRRL